MDAEAYLERGNAFFAMGQYNEAISDYIKAIEMNPSYFEAYYNRGQVYGKKGEFKLAICDFNKAIEINPEIEDEYLELLLDESNIIEDWRVYKRAWYSKENKSQILFSFFTR